MPEPKIHEEACFGCMNCTVACPMGVLIEPVLGMVPHVKRADECTGCKRCVDACPYEAIKVVERKLGSRR